MDAYTPIKGKCTWWREIPDYEDAYSIRVSESDKRVNCQCFVEGHYWTYTRKEVPQDCALARTCRYYIKNV